MTVIYLARHGQTEWNVDGRRQGRLDSPLTPAGLAQVRRNAELLSQQDVDAIYVSPLGRARATAEVFAKALRLPVHVLDELAEVDHGAWSGLTTLEIEAGWPGQLSIRRANKYDYRFPGGESYADAEVRAGRALAEVGRRGARRPLLVSHEMIGRMLLKRLGVPDALELSQPSEVVYRVGSGGRIDGLTWAE
ncbi:putative phosphoglycerate mutase [Kribbella antiqua]|uniref:Putative phosphoglycerate mutase n=1 Tax=Kribbella antiqua TaxID=2512217 RepID=A0A4R2IVP2_9ACTN|nr:histidine phosphatase family protein [Kribbella antiqua]TCO49484.1 putative phosphoglycerate mutase [Kribbella antiqua]